MHIITASSEAEALPLAMFRPGCHACHGGLHWARLGPAFARVPVYSSPRAAIYRNSSLRGAQCRACAVGSSELSAERGPRCCFSQIRPLIRHGCVWTRWRSGNRKPSGNTRGHSTLHTVTAERAHTLYPLKDVRQKGLASAMGNDGVFVSAFWMTLVRH